MKQKRNRFAWILFGIAGISLVIVCGLWFGMGKKETEPQETEGKLSVVSHGVELDIPKDFQCYPYEDYLLIYDEDSYAMKVEVLATSYEELRQEKESLDDKAKANGYTCLSEVTEYQVGEHQYLYFMLEFQGEVRYALFCKAGEQHSFKVVLQSGERKEAETLEIADSILGNARETDKEDTTYDELIVLQTVPQKEEIGDVVIQNSQGEKMVTYQVPEGFLVEGTLQCYEEAGYMQEFRKPDYEKNVFEGTNIYTTVSLYKDTEGRSAHELVLEQKEDWELEYEEIKSVEQNGTIIYYCTHSSAKEREDGDEVYYSFFAVMDWKDGMVFQVEGGGIDNQLVQDFETYKEFFILE